MQRKQDTQKVRVVRARPDPEVDALQRYLDGDGSAWEKHAVTCDKHMDWMEQSGRIPANLWVLLRDAHESAIEAYEEGLDPPSEIVARGLCKAHRRCAWDSDEERFLPGLQADFDLEFDAAFPDAAVASTVTDNWRAFVRRYPFIASVQTRFRVLETFMAQQRLERHGSYIQMRVRRNWEVEDAVPLAQPSMDLLHALRIVFASEEGAAEEGVDAGGLQREFFHQFWHRLTDRYGLLAREPGWDGLHPCTQGVAEVAELLGSSEQQLFWYVGRMLGKCIYERVTLPPLSSFFVSRLRMEPVLPSDLSRVDADLYDGLRALLRMDAADLEAVDQTFTVTYERLGAVHTEDLRPGGGPVTPGNVRQFYDLLARWHLDKRFGDTMQAAADGLNSVLPCRFVRLLSVGEMRVLFCAAPAIDVDDWQQYSVGGEGEPVAQWFWDEVRGMGEGDRRNLLKFVTGAPFAPFLGFEALAPRFTVCCTDQPATHMPSATTCGHILHLPAYPDRETLRARLRYILDAPEDLGFHRL